MDVIEWMRDSDPALRWQVERDLADEPPDVWRDTRARVASEGFGARLLALQDPDGQWAGGAYFPADFREGEEDGQPWTATTWSLKALREWGMDAAALGDTAHRLDRNSRWEYGDLPYWGGEVDCCINGWTIGTGAWLRADVSGIAEWFVEHRMADGGWNCMWEEGATVSSFHSTLNSLGGILAYEKATGGSRELHEARLGAQEYLLRRRLLHRLSTGELVGPWATVFAYPFRWRYTALRAVDYFLEAALFDGVAPDPRMSDAVEVVRAARQPDGTWLQGAHYAGREWFPVDVPPGEPSAWLTFFAMRALRRWDELRA
jgi:hypothetical protein